MNPDLLLLFSRYPEPGKVKTRLIPALGPDGAACLHRRLTVHTLETARTFAAFRPTEVMVYFDGPSAQGMQELFGNEFSYRPQAPGDLGQRLDAAMADSLGQGRRRVVLIGSDCPGITGKILSGAFSALNDHDLVLGPAADGGYYLIGVTALYPELFYQMPWGTSRVLAQTLTRAAGLGLRTALLETLTDIDRPEDLPVWEEIKRRVRHTSIPCQKFYHIEEGYRRGGSETHPDKKISVIIPALNEAETIRATLGSLRTVPASEIIVVDGGSSDATREIARAEGVTVLRAPRGRARQQNFGAAAASGEILFFLHADTQAPPDYVGLIRRALQTPGVGAGSFSLAITGDRPGLQAIATLANWRSRWLQLPYGDQGLFLSASFWARLGGYPEQPIMEDFALVRKIRRHGRLVTLPQTVLTSGRRWEQKGLWRTTWINQLMIFGYYLGVAPETLARLYRG